MEFGQDLVKGSVVPIVLALLRERAMYGYEIVKLVNARSGGRLQWREGTLYPALHKLEADGLLDSRWADAGRAAGEPDDEDDGGGGTSAKSAGRAGGGARPAAGGRPGGGRQRKYYQITRKGRTELARRSAEWREFSTAVNAILLGVQP